MLMSTMSKAAPPLLSVVPTRALVDEKFRVLVENLPAGRPVTVHSRHHSEDQDDWEAYGHYVSDHSGAVSVSDDLSFGGTYSGIEPMGLLWSMRPVPGSRKGLRLRKKNTLTPMLVHISVHSGHEGFRDRPALASVLTERWYVAPGVRRVDITENGVNGTLFIPAGPGPFPGLLDMWGGGGGLVEYRAALLASHGYTTLALDYFKPGQMASVELEFNYFEKAFNLVRDHPQVMPDRMGLFGLSFGTSVSMTLAARSSVLRPRACVCVSSGHTLGERISETNVSMFNHMDKTRLDEDGHHIWRDVGLALFDENLNKDDVKKINCPMLLVNGSDDQNWPSEVLAEDIADRMRAAGKEHLLTSLVYPGAGHLIEPPFTPHFRNTNFIVQHQKQKITLLWGGQTKPHSDAQEDSWRRILSFLQQHLYGNEGPKAKL